MFTRQRSARSRVSQPCLDLNMSSPLQEAEARVDVAAALGINCPDAQGPRNILLQLPCVLPAPAVEIKMEPGDRRRGKGAAEPQLQPQPALSLKALQAGKVARARQSTASVDHLNPKA